MHSTQIDPFDSDLFFEYDVRLVTEMSLNDARYLFAQLTIAKLQVSEYIKIKENKRQETSPLDALLNDNPSRT